jgi:hypothetical protein
MFLFASLLESSKASSSALGATQSTALQTTNEILLKYHNAPPKIQSNSGKPEDTKPSSPDLHAGRPIRDVVAVEKEYGIAFFKDYCGILIVGGRWHMVFTARFQRSPKKIHFVSCPQLICAPNLAPDDRESLRIKLDAVSGSISKEKWDKLKSHYNIIREEWLIIS